MFERRAADKLDYYDWKLSYMANEDDFKFINDLKVWERANVKQIHELQVCVVYLTELKSILC